MATAPDKFKALPDVDLETLDGARHFKAGELWSAKGALIMAVRRPG